MSKRRLLVAGVMVITQLLAADAAAAQDVPRHVRQPIPATMVELEAREAELVALTEMLQAGAEVAEEAEQVELAENLVGRTASQKVGPFEVVALAEDIDRAAEIVRRAWAHHDVLLGNDGDYLEGLLVRAIRIGGPLFPEPSEGARVLSFRLPSANADLTPDGWEFRGDLQGFYSRVAWENGKDSFVSWLGGGGIGQNSNVREMWTALATSRSPSGPACLEGSARDCIIALGLDPDGGASGLDHLDRLRRFLGVDTRSDALDWIQFDGTGRQRIDSGWADFLRACLDDPTHTEQVARSVRRCSDYLGGDQSYYFQSYVRDRVSVDLRRSLLNHALAVGPPGALKRLEEVRLPAMPGFEDRTTRDYEVVFEHVAQMPLEELADSWRSSYFDQGISHGGPASHHAPWAFFWAGLFVTFSFLSTRRRFG